MNNLIKKYREEAGFTQQQMADKLKVTVSSYNMMENNKRGISLIMAKKISYILNASIDDIFFNGVVHK